MDKKCPKCSSLYCTQENCIRTIIEQTDQLKMAVKQLAQKSGIYIQDFATTSRGLTTSQSPAQLSAQESSQVASEGSSQAKQEAERRVTILKNTSLSTLATKPNYIIKRVAFKEEERKPTPILKPILKPNPVKTYGDSQVQTEPQEVKEQSALLATSNDSLTRSHDHEKGGKLKIVVQNGDQAFELNPPMKGTGLALYKNVRNRLGMQPSEPLNLVFMNHTVINEDSKPLWNYGIRYYPAVITCLPERLQQGDRLNLSYLGKGDNVNGNYIALPKRPYSQ